MGVYILSFALIVLYGWRFKNKKTVVIASSIQLFLILALRNPLLGVDNNTYMGGYEYISSLSFTDMLSRFGFFKCADLIYPYSFESGYVILNWLVSSVGISFHGFLILHAAFCISAVSIFIYRYSDNPCFSFILYISWGFFTLQFGILRQTLALAILLFAFPFIEERKFPQYLLLCLLAFLIHRVTIIMLPLYFICNIKMERKHYVYALLVLLVILLTSPLWINLVFKAAELFGKQLDMHDMNINALFILMSFFAVMILFFCYFEKSAKDTGGNSMLIWSFLYAVAIEIIGLYSDILARVVYIPYIAIVALIPNILDNYENKKLVTLGKVMFLVCSFIFMIWGLKNDFINPYIFFFE